MEKKAVIGQLARVGMNFAGRALPWGLMTGLDYLAYAPRDRKAVGYYMPLISGVHRAAKEGSWGSAGARLASFLSGGIGGGLLGRASKVYLPQAWRYAVGRSAFPPSSTATRNFLQGLFSGAIAPMGITGVNMELQRLFDSMDTASRATVGYVADHPEETAEAVDVLQKAAPWLDRLGPLWGSPRPTEEEVREALPEALTKLTGMPEDRANRLSDVAVSVIPKSTFSGSPQDKPVVEPTWEEYQEEPKNTPYTPGWRLNMAVPSNAKVPAPGKPNSVPQMPTWAPNDLSGLGF